MLFKQLHVGRFWDASHQSFVYVVWTAQGHQWLAQEFHLGGVAQPWGSQVLPKKNAR